MNINIKNSLLTTLLAVLALLALPALASGQPKKPEARAQHILLEVTWWSGSALDGLASVPAASGEASEFEVGTYSTYRAATYKRSNAPAEISTDTIFSGIRMSLVPTVLADGTIRVDIQGEYRELLALNTVTVDNQTAQLPEVASRNFTQTAVVRSGELISTKFKYAYASGTRGTGGETVQELTLNITATLEN